MKDTRSAFRRFARFWRRQGAAVPGVVFVDPGAESAAAAHVVHASSTHISEREAEQIARWLDNRFFEEPLTGAKARVNTNLSSARPFRTEEVSKLRQNDAADSHGLIFVRTSGFSHLKWTQTARRSIEVPPELHRQVREFVDRVAALEGHSEFLFLWDDAAQQNQDVDRIDRALSEALRVVSGERTARRHSLRGSAIARRIFPDVEALIRALAANQAVHPARPETSEDAWLRVAIAAAQAGHAGMLSTLLYYFSVWPVALYVELAATLARLAPGDQLATLVDGWSPEAMRQALSRRRKAASVAGNDWSVFDGRLLRIERFPSLESLLDSEEITIEPLSASNSERATSHDEKHLHYMVLRLAGIPLITAGDATHLPMTLHAASEASLATYLAAEGRPAAAAGNGVEAALATAFGRDLLAAVRTTRDAQGLLLILSAINSTGIVPRAAGVAGVLSVARTLLRLLPSSHTLTVLPSVACADPSLFVHLSRVDPDIVVKATSRRLADGYRFGLTTRRPSGRGPRPDGRATALFSLVCHAWLALLLFP